MSKGGRQLQTGDLYGRVTDNQGQRLPGVTLTLTGPEAPRIQISNVEGEFRFLGLAPGTYKLTAELEGFTTVVYANIQIRVGRATTLEIEMSPAIEE